MKKWYGLLILLLVLSLILPACTTQSSPTPPAATTAPPASSKPGTPAAPAVTPATSAPAAGQPQPGGTLKIILTGPVAAIGTLGAPTETIAGMYGRVGAPAMEYLFAYDANERFMPQLAESWDITPDGKALTIKIRKGVKFQDGTPLNAQAVKECFDMMKVATNTPNWKVYFKNVASWEVIDEYAVKINFTSYDSNLMVNLSLQPLFSPTAMKIATTPATMAKDHMVGTGPFKFVSYARGQNVKYIKNTDYWQPGKPYLDAVELTQIDDPVTSTISFKKGEAQLIFGISPNDAVDLEKDGYRILRSSAVSQFPIVPDGANKDSPWSNLKVRQALEYALDRNGIASLGKGYWAASTQMAVPTDIRYVPGLTPRNYDTAKAKQLLAEAGYATGFKTVLVANSTYNKDILVAVQRYLKEIGVEATIDMADAARFQDMQFNGWKGLLFSGTPIVGNVQSMWNRFGGQTYPSMYRSTFQQKLDAAIGEPDYDKRLQNLKDMVKIMYDDASVIPMYASPDLSAADKSLQGKVNWQVGHPNMWYPSEAWLSK